MSLTAPELDAQTLRRMLRAGGLEVSAGRAERVLPVVHSLSQGWERLAGLDLASPGGSGIARAPE